MTGVMRISESSTSTPRVTQALLSLNILAFVLSVVRGGSANSIMSIHLDVLRDWALLARATTIEGGNFVWIGVDSGEYYRLVTYAFLHDGLFHLAFNMYALWLLGQLLEAGFGAARFLSLYVASTLGGAFGALLLTAPNSPTVGASGAVFGMMGAMVLVQRAIGGKLWRTPLGAVLIINLGLTLLLPGISIGGHFGGLATGLVLGAVMLGFERRNVPGWVTTVIGAALAALFVGASLLAAAP